MGEFWSILRNLQRTRIEYESSRPEPVRFDYVIGLHFVRHLSYHPADGELDSQ
jgi:hypothetical protein